ncbi:Uncharacterised protein [Kluyvera cryocrescens]|uniref:Uncharacterized protein n=1 Tax=Kluyvera cryocrescens TaxID=580 RepID=A0A485AUW9_KLUCR|nr:Uncharacterised protein [Kluyvera cryocrescens]
MYGIAELNNGQALNASFPYTMSDLARILDMGSWHYVNQEFEKLRKLTDFNIKASDNNYHVSLNLGKVVSENYSSEALDLLRKLINGEQFELNP